MKTSSVGGRFCLRAQGLAPRGAFTLSLAQPQIAGRKGGGGHGSAPGVHRPGGKAHPRAPAKPQGGRAGNDPRRLAVFIIAQSGPVTNKKERLFAIFHKLCQLLHRRGRVRRKAGMAFQVKGRPVHLAPAGVQRRQNGALPRGAAESQRLGGGNGGAGGFVQQRQPLHRGKADAQAGEAARPFNPTVGREYRLKLLEEKPTERKKVVIVGGGPAGMEAAIVAAQRGHDVTLLEKADHLGGKLVFSRQTEFKKDLMKFMDYQIHMVDKLGVQVRLNTEATPELVTSMEPDAVLAAVGADPIVPPIPGVDGKNVITAEQCYEKGLKGEDMGDHIAVLGGGLVGCETALYLSMYLGKRVTLIEMTRAIAQEEYSIPRQALVEHMDEYVTYYCGVRCTGITQQGMEVADSFGNTALIEADTVVLAAGMRARSQQAEQFRGLSLFFEPIGDCVVAKNVRGATRSGYDAASRL